MIVASGTTRAAFSTRPAGTVADSRPRKPQNVSPAAAAMAPGAMLTAAGATRGVPLAANHSARPMSSTSGSSLSAVVTTENAPAARTPRMLIAVMPHTQATARSAGTPGVLPIHGATRLRLLTTATAMAPLPLHSSTQ